MHTYTQQQYKQMEQIIEEIETLKSGLLRLEQLVKDTDKKRKRSESSSSSKKRKKLTLREEFILAGNDSIIFDNLYGKLSEQQLRDIYKF